MSEGMNRVTLLGNVGSFEQRHTQNGTAVLNIRLATNERIKSGEEWKDHTEWHNVVVWGKRAEGLGKILDKGTTLCIEGRLRTQEYESQGTKRWKTEVHADQVLLVGSRPREQQSPRPSGYQQPAAGGDFA